MTDAPGHVAILGLGPSLATYVDYTKRIGWRGALFDEVWGINAAGGFLQTDRLFHMDDLEVQERRAAAQPKGNIAHMLKWMRQYDRPVYTSRLVDGYPNLVEFPLEAVINDLGYCYFNSTAAYALAYAIHIGVERVSVFGFDFTYANTAQAEMGRACCEFWMGIGAARGVKFALPATTSLMDACLGQPPQPYGYDAHTVGIDMQDDGHAAVRLTPKDLPTAEEIERRYDHSRPANPLMRGD